MRSCARVAIPRTSHASAANAIATIAFHTVWTEKNRTANTIWAIALMIRIGKATK